MALAQRRAEGQPLLGEPVHVGAEQAMGRAARLLGLVHRRIGLLHQRIDIGGIVGIDADAHAGGHRHLPGCRSAAATASASVILEATSEARAGIAVRQHDDELVAAQAPQHVGRLDLRAQPLGKLDQQFVAGRMSERVVDVLEMVEVEKCQRDVAAGRTVLDGRGDQLRNCARFGRPVSMS